MLQLVLGCAVHCERKEEFISAILEMEEDVQRGIMAAIQELPFFEELPGGSLIPPAGRSPSQTTGMGFQNLTAQLETANEEKKRLEKERHTLNLQVKLNLPSHYRHSLTLNCFRMQISNLQDEIKHLQDEVETLKSGGAGGPPESLSEGANPSPLMQKREIQRLTEELLRSDSAREELRIRCEALEQELDRMKVRQDDLENAAEQTRSLKASFLIFFPSKNVFSLNFAT